jgi:hypothetical protein
MEKLITQQETTNDQAGGLEKKVWENMIKENMVPFKAGAGRVPDTYILNHQKNSAFEIHFGTRYLTPPRHLAKMMPAVGRRNDTLDVSSEEFLVLNKSSAGNACRQYIPWKKIFEIVFLVAEA